MGVSILYKLIVVALALSIDAFGIGLTYGIRGIKISNLSKLIVSSQSIIITFAAMQFGNIIRNIIPLEYAEKIGAFCLILLGSWVIIQSGQEKKVSMPKPKKSKTLSIVIKHLGITVQIIRSPGDCDMDNSATIDKFEAIYLGFALSIDAFVAVAGTGMIDGFSMQLPFVIAITQAVLLTLGSSSGHRIKDIYPVNPKLWTFCSGALLIAIALVSII